MSHQDSVSSSLSAVQIERLQNLIRQFKALGRRFAESQIPGLIEQYAQTAPPEGTIRPHSKVEGGLHQTEVDANNALAQKMGRAPGRTHLPQQLFPPPPVVAAAQHANPHVPPLQPLQQSHLPPHAPVPQGSQTQQPHALAQLPPPINGAGQHTAANGGSSSAPSGSTLATSTAASSTAVASATTATTATTVTSTLSWQCYHSLLALGFGKISMEGSCSLMPSDMGCFSKGAHLPLVPTIPSAASIIEEVLSSKLCANRQQGVDRDLFLLQHSMRSLLAGKLPTVPTSGAHLHVSSDDMISHRLHFRVRRQIKRDSKGWEKDERRRRIEGEERRKRKLADFHKVLMDHREMFMKFHKQKRSDCTKVVRATKLWVENNESRRNREEEKAEIRRLQALKENDMEAYTSLVQETKNGRLKFLLSETDNYIATINRLIQEQRVDGTSTSGSGGNSESHSADSGMNSTAEQPQVEVATAKNYYSSTHRMTEIVSQPRMLKGGDLKEYQLSGLQWLVSLYNNNLNGILADEMGLGKTIQTIALLSYIMEVKQNNGPFLIVVPLSTLSNWVNEFNKWAPDIIKVVYKGAPDERRRIFKDEVESQKLNVLLTTYEYIMRDRTSLRKLSWQYIIVDEGHRMKNAQSKFAMTLGNAYQSRHRILLTGTPLQNNLPELWALLNFLLPSIFNSVDTFDQWFNKPFAAFRTQAVAEDGGGEINVLTQEERMLIVHRLHEVLRPFMLRRVKDQVLDQLPEKVEKVLRCALSGWQRKMYHLIARKSIDTKEKDSEFSGLNNTIMQLRKVCNHPYLFIRDHIVDEDLIRASGKFELLDRMLPKLRQAGHRVLIFSQMVEVMNFLEEFFVYRGFRFLRLDGNTIPDEREKRMYAFNDPDSPYFIFLLSTRAGGLGLNLATADTVIIFDSDWNPMMDAQAQDRAHRIGQKNEVRVFRLLTNSVIEERILARANDKRNLNGLVVEAGKFNAKSSQTLDENKEMMEALLREWSSGGAENAPEATGVIEDFDSYNADADVPDDEQLNEMMAAYEGEMALYQEMDNALVRSRGKSSLMGANELPPWLLEGNWPTKYRQLMLGMMTTADPNESKRKNKRPRNAEQDGWEDEMLSTGSDFTRSTNLEPMTVLRKKKEVIYNDGLTDFQYQKLVEQQFDMEEKQHLQHQHAKGKKSELSEVYSELVKVIQDIQKIKSGDGLLAGLFLEKPSKLHYPDYYHIIDQPISLKEIIQRLRQGKYDYFEEVELDFALMSHNARTFNTDESQVFYNSELIRKQFYERASKCLLKWGLIDSPRDCPPLPSMGHHVCGYESGNFHILLGKADGVQGKAKKRRKV